MFSDYLKNATITFVAAICGFQAIAWLCGLLDEATKLLNDNRELGILTLFMYYSIYYIGYDAKLRVEKMEYNKRISKASLRPIDMVKTQKRKTKRRKKT